jgi:ribosome-binding protein aMBF1 (putative translation factor)
MKLKNKINPEFEDLFSFASKEEEIEHDAKMLMFNFLDKVQKIADEKKLSRKELAEKVGTSASYITQLFRGDKLVNMTIIAKFQKELGFKFNISIQK